jgi:CubicO group peptidase (beta-lactamase class C family)
MLTAHGGPNVGARHDGGHRASVGESGKGRPRSEDNGVRLLIPKTVAMMLTDQPPDLPTEFGLGFGLETAANDYQSLRSIGSFSLGGAFNTTYRTDPSSPSRHPRA